MPEELVQTLSSNVKELFQRYSDLTAKMDVVSTIVEELREELCELQGLIEASHHLCSMIRKHALGTERNPIVID